MEEHKKWISSIDFDNKDNEYIFHHNQILEPLDLINKNLISDFIPNINLLIPHSSPILFLQQQQEQENMMISHSPPPLSPSLPSSSSSSSSYSSSSPSLPSSSSPSDESHNKSICSPSSSSPIKRVFNKKSNLTLVSPLPPRTPLSNTSSSSFRKTTIIQWNDNFNFPNFSTPLPHTYLPKKGLGHFSFSNLNNKKIKKNPITPFSSKFLKNSNNNQTNLILSHKF